MRVLSALAPSLLLASLLFPAHLSGQACAFTSTADPTPGNLEDGLDYTLFGVRAGAVGVTLRTQVLVQRHAFQNVPVLLSDLASSVDQTGQTRFGSVVVRFGYTQRESLDSVFANNIAGPMTNVLEARDHAWPHRRFEWTDIGLQTPFLYVPAAGNLLIDVTIFDATPSAHPLNTVYAYTRAAELRVGASWTTSPPASGSASSFQPKLRLCADRPSLLYFGDGCPGSGGTRPALGCTGSAALGGTTTWWLSNAAPSTTAVLQLGADTRAPYPLPLDAAGMPGCRLYFPPLVAVVLATDGLGIASAALTIPPQAGLVGSSVYGQYFVVDPRANTAGLAASNYARALIGR